MRYTFQDSTDFPVQKDFIQDLQDFIAISQEVLPLEKSAIKIKDREQRKNKYSSKKNLQRIDQFEKDVRDHLESHTVGVEEDDILGIKARILETVSTVALAKKDEKIGELNKQNKLDMMEVATA